LLNIFTRPFGGYAGDIVYKWYGVRAKKHLTIACGILTGFMSIALGLYIDHHNNPSPSLAVLIVVMIILAIFDEIGNGANFSLVPHCNPGSNGLMTGIVGAMGNLGGVWFALMFRFQPAPFGKAFWIAGIVSIIVNALLIGIRVPKS
jgi:MFS transporter, NNP family, nitrate/nitrite transporter